MLRLYVEEINRQPHSGVDNKLKVLKCVGLACFSDFIFGRMDSNVCASKMKHEYSLREWLHCV